MTGSKGFEYVLSLAGYDPREATPFWERMGKDDKNGPPEILSTHPAPTARIANIRDYLPEVLQYYEYPPKRGQE